MAWNKEDISFKTLQNKRITNSSKRYFEEFGDFTLDISSSEIKSQDIPLNNPTLGVSLGIVKAYTLFTLTKDNTVDADQSYYASDATDTTRTISDNRLRDWISDKWGDSYSIKLYDSNNVLIPPTHSSQWLFNNITGILVFNGDTSGLAKPLKVSGYRYIGKKGITSGASLGVSITYSDLNNLYKSSKLEAGTQYLISDYKTIHIIPGAVDADRIYTSVVEPLYIKALTNSKLESRAISSLFPSDTIIYDISNSLAEDGVTVRPGKILYRLDTIRNISAHYDWRNVMFKRWIRSSDNTELLSNSSLANSSGGVITYAPHTTYTQTTFSSTATISNVHLPVSTLYGGYNNTIFKGNCIGLTVVSNLVDTVFYKDMINNVLGNISNSIIYGLFSNNRFNTMSLTTSKGDISFTTIQSISNCKLDGNISNLQVNRFESNTTKAAINSVSAPNMIGNIINYNLSNCKFFVDTSNILYTAVHSGINISGTTANGNFINISYTDGGDTITTVIVP